jgi:hypothetical protein
MVMYPLADVPALQLSIPTHDPATLLRIGERLRPLKEQGVLIIGSGFLTPPVPGPLAADLRDPRGERQSGGASHHGNRRLLDGAIEAVVPDPLGLALLEELADPGHRRLTVILGHVGPGHPHRVAEEVVLIQGLAASER